MQVYTAERFVIVFIGGAPVQPELRHQMRFPVFPVPVGVFFDNGLDAGDIPFPVIMGHGEIHVRQYPYFLLAIGGGYQVLIRIKGRRIAGSLDTTRHLRYPRRRCVGFIPEFPGEDVGIGAIPRGDVAQPVPVVLSRLLIRPEIHRFFTGPPVRLVEGIRIPESLVKITARGEFAIGAHAEHDLDALFLRNIEYVIEFPCVGEVVHTEPAETRGVRALLPICVPFNAQVPGGHPDPYPIAPGRAQRGQPVIIIKGAAPTGPAHILAHSKKGMPAVKGEKKGVVLVAPDKAWMRGGGYDKCVEGRRDASCMVCHPNLVLPASRKRWRKTYPPSRFTCWNNTFVFILTMPFKGLSIKTVYPVLSAGFMREGGVDVYFLRVEGICIRGAHFRFQFQQAVTGNLGGVGLRGCYGQRLMMRQGWRLRQIAADEQR
ncbi:MAG: hypothetical protein BWX80_03850 [Candidatus Hydrogenedentes bacterium ADurb.Bin101]|nr:MAG: hypothetical protein BWX80_03850 [Candidatus Hydrogenedentes bacterium ADurb.Bin101]